MSTTLTTGQVRIRLSRMLTTHLITRRHLVTSAITLRRHRSPELRHDVSALTGADHHALTRAAETRVAVHLTVGVTARAATPPAHLNRPTAAVNMERHAVPGDRGKRSRADMRLPPLNETDSCHGVPPFFPFRAGGGLSRAGCAVLPPASVGLPRGPTTSEVDMPGSDRHKYKPLRVRPREPDRLWLVEHSAATGKAVNAIVSDAIAAYRASSSGPTTITASGPTTSPSGPTTEKQPQRARAAKVPPAAPSAVAGLVPASSLPRRCSHPGKRSVGGYCQDCDHLILAGGAWA